MAPQMCLLGLVLPSYPYLRSAMVRFPLVKVEKVGKLGKLGGGPTSSNELQLAPNRSK